MTCRGPSGEHGCRRREYGMPAHHRRPWNAGLADCIELGLAANPP